MKTFDQIRKEIFESYESNRVKKTEMPSLLHGKGRNHNGHEGMATYHSSMADKYKGTEAGKHHQRAADHHSRAVNATRKGNVNSGLTHAKNALDAAKAAHDSHDSKHSAAGKSDSMSLYHDHKGAVNSVKQAKTRDDKYNQKGKPARSDKPIQRTIGKVKSKIKKALQKEESVQEDHGSGTADNYTHHVKGYAGERGDPEHHAMLAKAKARNVKVTAGKSKEYMYGGKHIILRGKKKDVDHVIDNHIGRDE